MIICEGKTQAEVGNEILQKLIEQGGQCYTTRSVGEGVTYTYKSCCYSDGKGSHCAVGWLITEDSPAAKDNWPVEVLVKEGLDLGANTEWIKDNVHFLEVFQVFHDDPAGDFPPALVKAGVDKALILKFQQLCEEKDDGC